VAQLGGSNYKNKSKNITEILTSSMKVTSRNQLEIPNSA
jgi:hypothetical protein